MTASEATEPQPSSAQASARAAQPDPAATHPLAMVPAALVSLSAVVLFGFLETIPGYVILLSGVVGGVLTDRAGLSRRLGADLAVIAASLTVISLVELKADVSWAGVARFTIVLGLALVIPFVVTRYVYKERSIAFPWRGGRWTRAQWTYVGVVIVAAYLILPFYFLGSGVYLNWPELADGGEVGRFFLGVNAVGLWDELFFICIVFTLLLRHFPLWIANVLQATIFVSFLWELGYQSWGPLLTIPFALIQGLIFNLSKRNLLYVVTVHLLFDVVVFLAIVVGRNPDLIWLFPLAAPLLP
ncbi:CPBP family glutamic-type intramembrane protease [Agrococcus jejuensis]|uniref:CPBP family glutamic-type intramembrane protease n=1 Tax=Agrococcus jejuensis TaxID=399736 RepID=UPI0021B583B7|nr:CPBP family glutamic-type intramembrane protease [Agrococcus jejuensis]